MAFLSGSWVRSSPSIHHSPAALGVTATEASIKIQQESSINLCHYGCCHYGCCQEESGLDSSPIDRPRPLTLRHAVRSQARHPRRYDSMEGIGRPSAHWGSETLAPARATDKARQTNPLVSEISPTLRPTEREQILPATRCHLRGEDQLRCEPAHTIK